MQIAIDETGKFELRKGDIALVTLVTLPDKSLDAFLSFIGSMSLGHFKSSELDWNTRERIIKYIRSDKSIKFTSLVVDSAFSQKSEVEEYRAEFLEKFDKNMIIVPKSNIEQWKAINLFRNHFKNLSNVDFVKFNLITNLYIYWTEVWLFDYADLDRSADPWKLTHVIDTQPKPEKFKYLVYDYIALTTNSRNPNFKIKVPSSFDDSHPFLKTHDIGGNFSISKFFADTNVSNEETFPVLILPDLIGNTIYRAIESNDKQKWAYLLKLLSNNRSDVMQNRHGGIYYIITGHNRKKDKSFISSKLTELHRLLI